MARTRTPWRTSVGWLITIALLVFAISDIGVPDDLQQNATGEEPDRVDDLRITALSDAQVNPGDAVVVSFAGVDPAAPLAATVGKKQATIVARDASSVVVSIPADTPLGKAPLRLSQRTQRSKAWDIHVSSTNYRKLVARLLGGLALFVFGLAQLAQGLRGLAGNRLRDLLRRLTVSPVRAMAVGTLVGAVTQLATSAAAFTVSLVEARMLAVGSAVAVLVGSHLGASITGALLPVQFAKESLLLVVIGVMWQRIARSRRGGAVAHLVLGMGLMLYGLHLLQTSVEPLVSDPKLLPYLAYLRSTDLPSILICAATGAVLAFVLQGPGPVYVLVVGLAQTTTALPLANALAILAGTNLGATLGMAIIAWQAGGATRLLARTQLLFGLAATALGLAMIPVWLPLIRALVSEDYDYGHSVVRSSIAPQVALGFAAAQLCAAAAWLAILPKLVSSVDRKRQLLTVAPASPQLELADVLEQQRDALALALEISCTGERARSAHCEGLLRDARLRLETSYKAVGEPSDPQAEQRARTLVADLQLQRGLEQAVRAAELTVERGVRLSEEEKQRLATMHAIAAESFDALLEALVEGTPLDLEEAGAREIRMNALEAEGRQASVHRRRRPASQSTSSMHIGVAELIDSYEIVGNHLFRVAKALADHDEL